jgi:lysine-N-methylase
MDSPPRNPLNAYILKSLPLLDVSYRRQRYAPARCQERRLSQTKLFHPNYAEGFRCTGPACEDTCCRGWNVPIDRASYERFQSLPAGPLRTLIDASILVTPQGAASAEPAGFAKLRMTESNQCPLFTADRLCRIQAECGEAFLPSACAIYPRILHSVGGVEEAALALSCPEAARLVLLTPQLLESAEPLAVPVEEAAAHQGQPWLPPYFWPIRQTALALVRNRAYPLWQRMFLLGVFCRELDAMAQGDPQPGVAAYLRGFQAAVASESLSAAMEDLPFDAKAQLDVMLRLAGMMLHLANVRPRFVECIHAFTTGIGNGPGVTLESLAARYTLEHDRAFAPFFERHPFILENYLINTIYRCQFPFGKEGMKKSARPSMTREFAVLTAQFALIKGLLIGVAGFHGQAFSTEHVIHTVQSASKHFEHHPEFLNMAYQLLVDSRMDDPRGLAILLRNAAPPAAASAPRPATPATQTPRPQI